MSGTAKHTIKEIAVFVLEEWGMMMVEPDDATAFFDFDAEFFVSSALYNGTSDGSLSIICQTKFLDVLSRNVLGLDHETSIASEDQLDSLRELVNITSGNFLTEAFGKDTVFALPLLSCRKTGGDTIRGLLSGKYFCCLADNEPVAFLVSMEAS